MLKLTKSGKRKVEEEKKMTIKSILAAVLVLLLPLGQANATLMYDYELSNWNDTNLDASGDYIGVNTGTVDGNTWFSMQWQAGVDNSLAALGIDQVYYNCVGCSEMSGDVYSVYLGSLGGSDITDEWTLNFGGDEAGGGFGSFSSLKSSDGGSGYGIDDLSTLFFVLDSSVTFVDNGAPTYATFAAHVRYMEECSGWASDGNTVSEEDNNCGAVPEPSILWLLGSGLVLIGFVRRKLTL